MANERERKFKCLEVPQWVREKIRPMIIRQGYLMLDLTTGKQLRVRIIDDEKGFICFKQNIKGTDDRDEFEYEIPLEDATKLWWEITNIRLVKTRYEFEALDGVVPITVAIDIYSDGDEIVEIEYQHPQLSEAIKSLTWIGEDITHVKQYSNIYKAIQNAKST